MDLQLKLIKGYFSVYSFFFPASAAKKGFNLFQKVRKKDIREREKLFFEKSKHFTVTSPVGNIDCYRQGENKNEVVLLVHGWDSNAGSMSRIADAILKTNRSVILFNLPGHAFSKKSSTNILECRLAMTAVLETIEIPPKISIVSHSFGSAVVAYTLSKLDFNVDKLVFLTNPNKIDRIFLDFKKMIGLGDKAYDHLLDMTEEKLGESISDVSVEKNLDSVNYNELCLIHDKHDKILSYNNSLEVLTAHPNAKLEAFEKIGHYKMLWNDNVVAKTISFLEH